MINKRIRFINFRNIALSYFLIGIFWIFGTDSLIFSKSLLPHRLSFLVSSAKGLIFIGFSAILLYLITKKAYLIQNKLKEVMQLGLMGSFEHNLITDRVWLSKETRCIFNIDKKEIPYEELLARLALRDVPMVREMLKQDILQQTGPGFRRSMIYQISPHPGIHRFVNITTTIQRVNGKAVLRKGIVQDITRIKELESDLNKSHMENNRLGTIMKNINTIIIITDHTRKISWTNNAFTEKLHYTLAEVSGKEVPELLYFGSTSVESITIIEKAVSNRTNFTAELQINTKNNESLWVKAKGSPVTNSNGEFMGYITLADDISERKDKEFQLNRQNAFLREITWLSSHHLRRPVASILGLIALLQQENNPKDHDECMELLSQSAKQLDEIIKDVNTKINAFGSGDSAGTELFTPPRPSHSPD